MQSPSMESPMNAATIRLQHEPFDAAAEAAELRRGRTDIGAIVTFSGTVRGGSGTDAITAMTLEHYPGMTEAELGHSERALKFLLLAHDVYSRAGIKVEVSRETEQAITRLQMERHESRK